MEKNVQLKYRLYRRRNGVFYWQENDSAKQATLRTTDRREAERLLNAMNESHREPTLNLNLARAYLAADRKSTRLNSSHRCISYAVFCLKKKKKPNDKIFFGPCTVLTHSDIIASVNE